MEDDISNVKKLETLQNNTENVSSSKANRQEEDLYNFREQWQKELRSIKKSNINEEIRPINSALSDKAVKQVKIVNETSHEDDINEKAAKLFMKGTEMENSGKLYEAIQFYRQAVQIVPDIEFIMNKRVKPKMAQEVLREEVKENIEVGTTSSDEDEDNQDEELFYRIQRKASKKCTLCLPKQQKNGLHIGQMPVEIILYILKWVVSDQLDLRSLEMFSNVCRGFYLCARDPEIWRMACIRTWGVNCGTSTGSYKSWRDMFIERPRVNFNGCYISKNTYIRNGENSFQDQFYRPWYLVAYYRYLRFYPDGTVLMLTSAEEPLQSINLLKIKNVRSPVLSGYYRLKDDKVILVIQRQTKNSNQETFRRAKKQETIKKTEQIYNMEFQIRSKRKKHEQLHWHHYSIVTKSKKGDETTCNFDLWGNRFPPLVFSRVKSYAESSENPLI